MNTLVFALVLLAMGAVMAILSFAIIYGIATVLGIGEVVDARITFSFFILSCIVVYGMSFGVFAGVQKDNCGEVKNWKQIALNALIPLAFQATLLTAVLFIPWFQNIVGNVLSPDTPPVTKTAIALAYYSFWATMMGGALGGTFSGSCKVETPIDVNFLDQYTPSMPKELSEFAEENKDIGVKIALPAE
jgi:hypothetical protein